MLDLLELRTRLIETNQLATYYPDSGPLRRDLYPKHLEFFASGKDHRERAFLAGNRCGKSIAGAYEMAVHLTGLYPDWWEGRRFDHAISAWAAGDSGKTVRDVIQLLLLGRQGAYGTGMIPADRLVRVASRPGVPDAIELVHVRHESGGVSELGFKSFAEGTESFQGTSRQCIWIDEECPLPVYAEALLRTMTCDGLVYLTFTPLKGLSDTVLQFLPGGTLDTQGSGNKYVVMMSWADAPHLSEDSKKELWDSIPPYQRDARSKGVPSMGSGSSTPLQSRTSPAPRSRFRKAGLVVSGLIPTRAQATRRRCGPQ